MYSQELQNYLNEIIRVAEIRPEQTRLLEESLSCYLSVISYSMGGSLTPASDLLNTTLHLMSLSIGLTEMDQAIELDGSHYLVGMGFEQSGELLSRKFGKKIAETRYPLANDYWYRLALAFLHYMAGGFRVQAISALRHLEQIGDDIQNVEFREIYLAAGRALRTVFNGRRLNAMLNPLEEYLFGENEPLDLQGRRLFRLTQKIRRRRQIALVDLGLGDEAGWLSRRRITAVDAEQFWQRYLEILESRGFTNFTDEQIGPGFDNWLIPTSDLLVLLPTGSGKTLIAELKTAISLVQGHQVVWMLPTRSLVRQTKRELSGAFTRLDVDVEELPSTEDFIPLFIEDLPDERLVAATTPEKISALLRSNPNAIARVRLVVLDEAQILFDNRGTTAEYVLQEIHRLVPDCRFVLMSAFEEYTDRLRNFMQRLLGRLPIELTSSTRPTRRVNGIITNYSLNNVFHPTVMIYPPGLQGEQPSTQTPFRIDLPNKTLSRNPGPTELAQSIANRLIGSDLRAVMFVGIVASTETQANAIVENVDTIINLPDADIARLRTELGRESAIENPSAKRVAPHHAGLTPLEQHIVEKWTRNKTINIVVATQSLAQGVNLPFDISIVSFLRQHNPGTQNQELVPISTMMNMLGRAGRAGQVTDGVCLIATRPAGNNLIQTLNNNRKYFFRPQRTSQDHLGLAKLLRVASHARINDPEWLLRLDQMDFSQSQTLVSFSLNAAMTGDQIQQGIRERLLLFPSIQDLIIAEDSDNTILALAASIEPLIQNIIEMSGINTNVLGVLSRTGMPFEIVNFFLEALSGVNDPRSLNPEQALVWADQVVMQALHFCAGRQWYSTLMGDIDLQRMMSVISLWRTGTPLAQIEQEFILNTQDRKNRINVGKFLNHKLSLIAQFWGTLAVCDEVLFPDADIRRPFEPFQTFVREGVNSMLTLEWLNKLGGLDRVLAHKLSTLTPVDNIPTDHRSLSRYIRRRINRWKAGTELIPIELNVQETGALRSILDEQL